MEADCKCDPTPGPCDALKDERICGHYWSACPFGELRHPMWQLAAEKIHAAEISPLMGWPDTYSAGLYHAMMAYRHAKAEWMARDKP